MEYNALKKLQRAFSIKSLNNIKILSEHWNTKYAGRIGAIRRYKLYGNPGTPEGRSKGGRLTQRKFRSNPEYAKSIGFKIRKEIKRPLKTPLFSEFIGVILGDGCITEHQVKILVNSNRDVDYAYFIRRLIKKLFGLSSSVNFERKNTLSILVSSKNLVEFLLDSGLKRGDKIRLQADVPNWVLEHEELMRGCIRGLIDTDGCIFFHRHTVGGIKYRNIGLMFTSLSAPLLHSVHRIFLALGIDAKHDKRNHVVVYNRGGVTKYMQEVGSHNKKHIVRFRSYKQSKVFI